MAYILHKEKPYYFNGKAIFPCSISAKSIKTDFDHPIKEKIKIDGVYNESEIKHRLGVMMIDTWDEKQKKVIKKSNITVSSMKAKNESNTPPEEVKAKDGEETKTGDESNTPPEEVKK